VDDSTCELKKMYCLPQYRGQGLGRTLMEFAPIKARELGFKRMILETAAPLKRGHRPIQPLWVSALCSGQSFSTL
jgi:putative acetyltransferase